jgi:hypothetical protein
MLLSRAIGLRTYNQLPTCQSYILHIESHTLT